MSKKHAAPPAPPAAIVIADDFTGQQIEDHLAASLLLLVNLRAQWPGLVSLTGTDRVGNVGRVIARMSPPIHELLAAVTPVDGESPATAATKKKLAGVLNTALGDADHGHDPEVFEVDLLARRLDRIAAQQEIIAQLDVLRKAFADDILNTATMVIEPGMKATDVGKSLAASNPEFRSLLAPMVDKLGDMTKPARLAQEAARKAVAAQKEAALAVAQPEGAAPAAETPVASGTTKPSGNAAGK